VPPSTTAATPTDKQIVEQQGDEDLVPLAFWQIIQTMNLLPEKTIFFQFQFLPIPIVSDDISIQLHLTNIKGFYRVSYQIGFTEKIDFTLIVKKILTKLNEK